MSLTLLAGLGSEEPKVSKPSTSHDEMYWIRDGTSGDLCSVISITKLFSMLDLKR